MSKKVDKVIENSVAIVESPPIGHLVLTDPDALSASLQNYSKSRAILLKWIGRELIAGSDYMVIHRKLYGRPCPQAHDPKTTPCAGCGSKATLLQPGSQKICALLKVVPTFRRDQDTWEMLAEEDRTAGTLIFVCELHQGTADGPVVAEGRGARATAQDQGNVNTSVKLGQKSAMVDATIRLGGLSDAYTQDVGESGGPKADNGNGGEGSGFGPPPRRSAGPRSPQPAPESSPPPSELETALRASLGELAANRPADAITKAQCDMLYAKLRSTLPDPKSREAFAEKKKAFKEWAAREYGVEHIEHLRRDQMTAALAWLDPKPPSARLVRRGGRR